MAQKYNKLAGKRVLIVGGTSGIGFCVAEAALVSSASVVVSSSSIERVNAAVERLKTSFPSASIEGYTCDLSEAALEQNIEDLFKKSGSLDHVVYTAGDKLATIPIQEATYETIERAGRVRFFGAMLTAKVASRYLKPSPESSITLTTGSVSEKPMPNWSVIAAYASGLHGLIRNLALDLRPIRVNLVSPGAVDTELWRDMGEQEKEGMFEAISSKVLTGRVGRPEDVAETYLWLMKDANVTGEVAHSNSGSFLV